MGRSSRLAVWALYSTMEGFCIVDMVAGCGEWVCVCVSKGV